MDIIIATNNTDKTREIKNIVGLNSLNFYDLKDINFTEAMPEEDGITFNDNSKIKSEFIANKTGEISIGDDSGLCVKFLNGEPGVNSKRYSGKGDTDNIDLVLNKLKDVPYAKRKAYFITSISISIPITKLIDGKNIVTKIKTKTFTGKINGHIIFERKGTNGFGYDSIFCPEGYEGETFATLDPSVKNSISHRKRALEKASKYLRKKFA